MWSRAAAAAAVLAVAACRAQPSEPHFPTAHRDVAPIVGGAFSTEDARDRLGEAEEVMDLAGVKPGMSVADVGAGEGYYTVRLARVVGSKGRVLAEDIVPEVRDELSDRVQRERLDNVAVKLGTAENPMLPAGSFDRVFLVHMYHEVQAPYAFLWHMRDGVKAGGLVVVVERGVVVPSAGRVVVVVVDGAGPVDGVAPVPGVDSVIPLGAGEVWKFARSASTPPVAARTERARRTGSVCGA